MIVVMKKKSLLFLFLLIGLLPVNVLHSQVKWKKAGEELIVQDPPFNQCHASTIVENEPGHFLVAFFGGAREGANDVVIWLTAHTKEGWTKPFPVADGKVGAIQYPCWNPVIFKTSKNRIFLFYKVGPNPREWWGMMRSSSDNGKTWGEPVKLPTGILGPIKNKPLELPDGTLLCPSSVETEATWKVHVEKSILNGDHWQTIFIDTASPYRVIQPTLLTYPGNKLQMLCRSDQDHIVSAWSDDAGKSWSKFSLLDLPNPNSGIDAVTLKSGTQLLVYNPTGKGREWSHGRGKLAVAISKDGLQWKDVMTLEDGDQSNEFSYPAVIQSSDGKVHITYTYNRKNIKHVILEAK
jgi:predicted neuraminidase